MTAPVVEDERLSPLPAVVAYLVARHEEDQEEIARALALALFPLWQIMRFTELDSSLALWLPPALERVETAFLQSQRLTTVFAENVRFASIPLEKPLAFTVADVQIPRGVDSISFQLLPVEPDEVAAKIPRQEFDRADVAKTLSIEANYKTKAAMPGPERELMHAASVRASGGAIREALNGGRGVVNEVVKRDRKIIGFARVTDSDPCPLCAILASRGAVYGKGSFISSDKKWKPNPNGAKDLPDGWTNVAKVHDHCQCTLRPVYAESQAMDEVAEHFAWLWEGDPGQRNGVVYQRTKAETRNARHKEQFKLFKEAMERNPAPGRQFDLMKAQHELEEQREALLAAGKSLDSAVVRWNERMQARFAA